MTIQIHRFLLLPISKSMMFWDIPQHKYPNSERNVSFYFLFLPEITALRAKIAEMREMALTQERDIRERVKESYDSLVQNLFEGTFSLKLKFDEFG